MDVQTGELSLKNPESDTEWEMYKSTPTEKESYYCGKKGGGGRNQKSCAMCKVAKLRRINVFYIPL